MTTITNTKSLTSVRIPEGVTHIIGNAFNNCENLKSINVLNNIESIGKSAFQNTKLNNIKIFSETIISDSAFQYTDFEIIVIPNNITEIKANTFANCTKLKEIIIPSSVTIINYGAFYNCTSLQHIICLGTTAPALTTNEEITPFTGINIYGTLDYPTNADYSSWLSFNEGYLGYYGWNDTIISTDETNLPFMNWAREQQWVPSTFTYMTSHHAALITQAKFNSATLYMLDSQSGYITGRASEYIDTIEHFNEFRYFINVHLLNSQIFSEGAAPRLSKMKEITLPDTTITFQAGWGSMSNICELEKLTIPANCEITYVDFYGQQYSIFTTEKLKEIVFESITQPSFLLESIIHAAPEIYESQYLSNKIPKYVMWRHPYESNSNYSTFKSAIDTFEWIEVRGIYENIGDIKIWNDIDTRIDISQVDIIQTNMLTYTGSQQTALFTVYYNGVLLSSTNDYTIVTNSNKGTNAGVNAYTFIINGKGDYKGQATKQFTIYQRNISNLTLTSPSSVTYIYDGSYHGPGYPGDTTLDSCTILDQSSNITYNLTKTTDFILTGIKGTTSAGNYTTTIEGVGNYTGSLPYT